MKHTLGPWRIESYHGDIREHTGEPDITGYAKKTYDTWLWGKNTPAFGKLYDDDPEQLRANARLIAKAPEMLDALQVAMELLDNSDTRHFIGKRGEMATLHRFLNAARPMLRELEG